MATQHQQRTQGKQGDEREAHVIDHLDGLIGPEAEQETASERRGEPTCQGATEQKPGPRGERWRRQCEDVERRDRSDRTRQRREQEGGSEDVCRPGKVVAVRSVDLGGQEQVLRVDERVGTPRQKPHVCTLVATVEGRHLAGSDDGAREIADHLVAVDEHREACVDAKRRGRFAPASRSVRGGHPRRSSRTVALARRESRLRGTRSAVGAASCL
jgi:hypothetical protein